MIFFENERACMCAWIGRKFAITYTYTWFNVFNDFPILEVGNFWKRRDPKLIHPYIYINNLILLEKSSSVISCVFVLRKYKINTRNYSPRTLINPMLDTLGVGKGTIPNHPMYHKLLIAIYLILYFIILGREKLFCSFCLFGFVGGTNTEKDRMNSPPCFGSNAWHITNR